MRKFVSDGGGCITGVRLVSVERHIGSHGLINKGEGWCLTGWSLWILKQRMLGVF